MRFYSCSESAPDLASRDEGSLTSATFEMEKLTKHCRKQPITYSWPVCMFLQKVPQPCLNLELSQS